MLKQSNVELGAGMKDFNGRVFQVGDYITGKQMLFIYIVLAVDIDSIRVRSVKSGQEYVVNANKDYYRVLEPEELI